VERSSSHDKVTRQLEGGEGAAAGGHYKRCRGNVACLLLSSSVTVTVGYE
jgi:hypothetical protein